MTETNKKARGFWNRVKNSKMIDLSDPRITGPLLAATTSVLANGRAAEILKK